MRWQTAYTDYRLGRALLGGCRAGNTYHVHSSRHASTSSNNICVSAKNASIARTLARPNDVDNATEITVVGSVRTIRRQKNITFLEIADGSCAESLKALIHDKQLADGLATGASVALRGLWKAAPDHAEQRHELQVEQVRILGDTDESYPIQKKYHTPEYLRRMPHLRLRTPINTVLARMRSEAEYQLTKFFRSNDFVKVQGPVITSSDCEGAGEVFKVGADEEPSFEDAVRPNDAHSREEGERLGPEDSQSFFKSQKYLTVSSQLHLEAFAHIHPRVWTLAPTFRAEKSDTPRHISEFSMLEVEMCTEKLSEVMDTVEDVIRAVVNGLRESSFLEEIAEATRKDRIDSDGYDHEHRMENLHKRWHDLSATPWPRITYEKAMRELRTAYKNRSPPFDFNPHWTAGLKLEHERHIADKYGQGRPVFVTDYPTVLKPFYMLPTDPSYPEHTDSTLSESSRTSTTVSSFDLLLPDAAEVVGGSLREHRLDRLHENLQRTGSNKIDQTGHRNLDWYIDLRRYGSIPHGGFGLGFDRLLGYLAGVPNIKDVVPWPRHFEHCDC